MVFFFFGKLFVIVSVYQDPYLEHYSIPQLDGQYDDDDSTSNEANVVCPPTTSISNASPISKSFAQGNKPSENDRTSILHDHGIYTQHLDGASQARIPYGISCTITNLKNVDEEHIENCITDTDSRNGRVTICKGAETRHKSNIIKEAFIQSQIQPVNSSPEKMGVVNVVGGNHAKSNCNKSAGEIINNRKERRRNLNNEIKTSDNRLGYDSCSEQQFEAGIIKGHIPEESRTSLKYFPKFVSSTSEENVINGMLSVGSKETASEVTENSKNESVSAFKNTIEGDESYKTADSCNKHMNTTHRSKNIKKKKNQFCCKNAECDFKHRSHSEYAKHMKEIHSNESPFECEICTKTFSNLYSLTEHRKYTHSDKLNCVCSFCGQGFKRISGLNNHIKYKHSNGEKAFHCDECGEKFVEKSKLKNHKVNKHSSQMIFQCSVCKKGLGSKNALDFHLRIHEDKKPFECSECSKKFRSKSDLVKHKGVHNQQKVLRCKICYKTVARNDYWRKHLKLKHNLIPSMGRDCYYSTEEKGEICIENIVKEIDSPLSKAISETDRNMVEVGLSNFHPESQNTSGVFVRNIEEYEIESYGIETENCKENLLPIVNQPIVMEATQGSRSGRNRKQVFNMKYSPATSKKQRSEECVQQTHRDTVSTKHNVTPLACTWPNEFGINSSLCYATDDAQCIDGNEIINQTGFYQSVTLEEEVETGYYQSEKLEKTDYYKFGQDKGKLERSGYYQSGLVEEEEEYVQKLPVNMINKLESVMEAAGPRSQAGELCISGTLEHTLGQPANLVGTVTYDTQYS